MFYLNTARAIWRNLLLNRRMLLAIGGVIVCSFMAVTLVPVTFQLVSWFTVENFLIAFRFEFYHGLLYLLPLLYLLNISDWWLLRQFQTRLELAVYQQVVVGVTSMLYTLFVSMVAYILYGLIELLKWFDVFHYQTAFHYNGSNDAGLAFPFYLVFWLVLLNVGLLYACLQAYLRQPILSMAIVIVLLVLDMYAGYSFFALSLQIGWHENAPLTIGLWLLLSFVLHYIHRWLVNRKDIL